MHPVLATALAKIRQERDEKSYSASLDAVSAIVRHFGEVNLAEVLFSEIPRTVPFELVAELFDLLAWQTNDNGASMARTTEAWLREGSDSRKLLIALHLRFTRSSTAEKWSVSCFHSPKPMLACPPGVWL